MRVQRCFTCVGSLRGTVFAGKCHLCSVGTFAVSVEYERHRSSWFKTFGRFPSDAGTVNEYVAFTLHRDEPVEFAVVKPQNRTTGAVV